MDNRSIRQGSCSSIKLHYWFWAPPFTMGIYDFQWKYTAPMAKISPPEKETRFSGKYCYVTLLVVPAAGMLRATSLQDSHMRMRNFPGCCGRPPPFQAWRCVYSK